MIDWRREDWMILNDSYEKERGLLYIAKMGASGLDYAVVNADAEEEILMVDEGEREESNQLPTVVTVKGSKIKKRQAIQGKERRFGKECLDGREYRKVPRKMQRLEQLKGKDEWVVGRDKGNSK